MAANVTTAPDTGAQVQQTTERGVCHQDALKQLWEEYRYRHDLAWRLIVQVTAASVILAVLPYVQDRIAGIPRWWILAVPALAVLFVAFALLVLLNELAELQRVRDRYREERWACFGVPIADRSHFRMLVVSYFVILLLIGLANLAALGFCWIPRE